MLCNAPRLAETRSARSTSASQRACEANARAAEAPLPWGQPMTRSSSPELMSIGLGALISVLNAQAGSPTVLGPAGEDLVVAGRARRQPGGRRPAHLRDAQGREVADREVEPDPAAGHDVVAGQAADRERGARAGAGGRQVDREAALREAEAGRPADRPAAGDRRRSRRRPRCCSSAAPGGPGRASESAPGPARSPAARRRPGAAGRSESARCPADSPTGAPRRRRPARGTIRPGTRRRPGRRSAPPCSPAGRSIPM